MAAVLGTGQATAASEWTLTSLSYKSTGGTSAGALSGTRTFSVGPGNSLTADGTFNSAYKVGLTPLYTWTFGSDFSIDGILSEGLPGTGNGSGSFTCAEGAFGSIVGANICGNYTFGANGYNESTANPDGSNRVIGGDDQGLGPAQSIADFAVFNEQMNPWWIDPEDWVRPQGILVLETGGAYSGTTWVFEATPVPVPAAAWLFGSALGLVGWLRRHQTLLT